MTCHERFDLAALEEIKGRKLPAARADDLFSHDGGPDADACVEAANVYLKAFLYDRENRKCVCCGSALGGFLGAFRWGLAHGEGDCGQCGYPARGVHKIEGVGTIRNLVLQYHPDGLSFESRCASDGHNLTTP